MTNAVIRYLLLACSLLAALGFTLAALHRLHVDTDIVRSMPGQEQVMRDALEIFENHPVHDQVAVDVDLGRAEPDQLVAVGQALEEKMRASGLFAEVGNRELSSLMPALLVQVSGHLPLLFSEQELQRDVAPRLKPEAVQQRVQELARSFQGMDGIGQAGLAAADPLGLRDLILAKLAPLAPTLHAKFYRGSLISADEQHLLVTARPLQPGSDTDQARLLAQLFQEAEEELLQPYQAQGLQASLTPVGAYRVALDNEEVIRHDVQLALLLSTFGIALLLFFTFPRPFLGLLSLLPSLVGSAAALLVYSFFFDSISILVLGFGGALISITVDFGITYLLLLDRPHITRGREVAQEVRAIGGRVALLTTVGAFLVLGLSGFPMFAELGIFTALGFLGTYLYVMLVFPYIFTELAPGPERPLPLRGLVRWLSSRGWAGAIFAALVFVFLLLFAKPVFHISLQDMSSVRTETRAADSRFTQTWGDVGARVYLMARANDLADLQEANDRLLVRLEEDLAADRIASVFSPSMVFPGPSRSEANQRAWHAFWTPERRAELQKTLAEAGLRSGFAQDAFMPFLAQLEPNYHVARVPVPPAFLRLLSVSQTVGQGGYVQFISLKPGSSYDPAQLFTRYSAETKIFDGPYFAKRLGEILFSTFLKGLALIVALVAFFHLLFSLSLRLTALTLLPPFFAFVCTLGTLKLLGHPLDIPALMLAIVIFGMGDDYSVYTVYGYQWYRSAEHPSYLLVRTTVFMAAASSLIGFGVLCFAEHSLLRSVGLTSVLGIGYSLLGAALLLPPLLKRQFENRPAALAATAPVKSVEQRVLQRYRLLEPYPRIFVRSKLALDPMFRDLPLVLASQQPVRTVYDIGCGFGLPGCWFLEQYPGCRIFGIDPDADRVRVAALATGAEGCIRQGWATDRPFFKECVDHVDMVLLMDMLHYLDDHSLTLCLEHARDSLGHGGLLLIRHSQKPKARRSWRWHLEDKRVRLAGHATFYRPPQELAALAQQLGFAVLMSELTRNDSELAWLLCRLDTPELPGTAGDAVEREQEAKTI